MPTYTPLDSITLTSSTTSIKFLNISQNYKDLRVVVSGLTNTVYELQIRINNDSSALYSRVYMEGDGSTASSTWNGGGSSWLGAWCPGVTGQLATHDYISYSNTSIFKTMLNSYNTNTLVGQAGMLYESTSAITSLEYFVTTSTINAGTTFDLYGISPAAADTAQAFGGTEIIYTNTHVIHVFKASGIFIPYRNLTADYLVVAGGGAGGGTASSPGGGGGGGGGAGGLRSTVTATGGGGSLESALSLTAGTSYTVTIGAGGTGAQTFGGNGSNSVFSTITSDGGGGGGGKNGANAADGNGRNGGSGGGEGEGTNGVGSGTANQGYAGAVNIGGGGGAGGAGVSTSDTTNTGGTNRGGAPVSVSITGTSVAYAGGGNPAGSQGNTGGGGNGDYPIGTDTRTAGTTNTGGGGGAVWKSSGANTGANGGSGIVIVRYAR